MIKKITTAGICVLALALFTYACTELALAERGVSAMGGEIFALPIIGFCVWAGVKTGKDIKRSWKS